MEVSTDCGVCHARLDLKLEGPSPAPTHCEMPLLPYATDKFLRDQSLNQCPHCGAAHLYRQRDFNRRVGVALVVVGIGLAYWTYGISLLVVTAVDWWLYRRVGEVGCCYQCTTLFRGETIAALEPFDLELEDYYRSRAPDSEKDEEA